MPLTSLRSGLFLRLNPLSKAVLIAASLVTAMSAVSAQDAPAPSHPTLAQRCVANAAVARGIAQDRDAGVLQGEEVRKVRERVAASGLQGEERLNAMAKQSVLVREIYTLYLTIPPATIYSKYMGVCAKIASNPQ